MIQRNKLHFGTELLRTNSYSNVHALLANNNVRKSVTGLQNVLAISHSDFIVAAQWYSCACDEEAWERG